MKKYLFYFTFAYLFLLPWDSYFLLNLSFPFSPSFVFLGLILLIFIIDIVYLKKPLIINHSFIILFFLYIYIFSSILWTPTDNGLFRFGIILSYLLTSFLLYYSVQHYKLSKQVLLGYFFGILSISIFAFYASENDVTRFSVALDYNPTWFAAQVLWALLISLFILKKASLPQKIFFLSATLDTYLL